MSAPPRITLRLTPDKAILWEQHILESLPPEATHHRLVRRSIDARHGRVHLQYTVEYSCGNALPLLAAPPPPPVRAKGHRAVVVGAGPAGLMAAYALVHAGVTPIVLDRGSDFPIRHLHVRSLRRRGEMLGAPALTCGLGGAGTYSDGKLMTRRSNPSTRQALALLAWFGKDPGLVVESHPHVGSNKLPGLVESLRRYLEEHGAHFYFNTTVTGLATSGGRVVGADINTGETVAGEAVVLAAGNSARTLLAKLHEAGVAMEARPFAMGVRVEHLREWVDHAQYGADAGHSMLGAARYAFAFSDGPRAVYSFCMCPGGHLLPTPPEAGHLAVNGMSFAKRSGRWSNAALVAATTPQDWAALDGSALGGIALQRAIESKAFAVAGSYHAPAQRLPDFLAGRASATLPESSYRPGLVSCRVDQLLPETIVDALRTGFARAEQKMRGYIQEEALVVAPETLTSTPIRILRNDLLQSRSHPGLFPCGEGSGWAGGITSSAADGLRAGELAAGWISGSF